MDTNKIDFSDDENENEEEIIEELPEEDEMDAETRAYIFSLTANKQYDDDFFSGTGSKKKNKKRKDKKQRNNMMIDFTEPDYNIKVEEKTWKSKRVSEKKPESLEYKFKPRMVPYEHRVIEENQKNTKITIEDFPSLA